MKQENPEKHTEKFREISDFSILLYPIPDIIIEVLRLENKTHFPERDIQGGERWKNITTIPTAPPEAEITIRIRRTVRAF